MQRRRRTGSPTRSRHLANHHDWQNGPEAQIRLTGPEAQIWLTGPEAQIWLTGPEAQIWLTGPEAQIWLTGPEAQIWLAPVAAASGRCTHAPKHRSTDAPRGAPAGAPLGVGSCRKGTGCRHRAGRDELPAGHPMGVWLGFARWSSKAASAASHLQGPKTLTMQLDHLLSLVRTMLSGGSGSVVHSGAVVRTPPHVSVPDRAGSDQPGASGCASLR